MFHFCSTFCMNRFDVRPDRYGADGDDRSADARLKRLLAEYARPHGE